MIHWNLIVCLLYAIVVSSSSSVAVLGEEASFQYVDAGHYKRNSFENINFDELFDDFMGPEADDLTSHEYKFIINRGLSVYFLICDRMERLKRGKTENSLASNDQLKFTSPPSGVSRNNFTFFTVEGLSRIKAENVDVHNIVNGSQPHHFEVKSEIYLPSFTFKGISELGGVNQSLDYEMSDILYTDWQRKKVTDDYEIKLSRSFEKLRVNTTKLIVKNVVNVDAQYRELETEITKDVSKYLPKLVEQIKAAVRNATIPVDVQYLQVQKEKHVHKLSLIIAKLIRTHGNISTKLPRFSFVHEGSATAFDLLSGDFELDVEMTNFTATLQPNGDFVFTSPADGTLTYFVTEQNCTESCNTYGDRAKVRAIEVVVTFGGRKLDKVYMTLNLEPGSAMNDHYLRKPAESITASMMTKISKVLGDRLLTRLKNFLK